MQNTKHNTLFFKTILIQQYLILRSLNVSQTSIVPTELLTLNYTNHY